MTATNEISVFDIIGPIMVGPSSSHTAGAVRLGQIARTLLDTPPETARIELHGSFARTGKGHGTDKALVAGLLGFGTEDERIRDSFAFAAAQGLHFEFTEIDLGSDAHPNSVHMLLQSGTQQVEITGASIGGGMVEITRLQDYPVHFSGDYHTLIVIAQDQPGTINTITGWLGSHNINVAFLRVGRQGRGGEAIMIIETDERIPDGLVGPLRTFPWVRWVRKINKVGA